MKSSLKAKIYAGFIVILLMLLLTSLVSFIGLAELSKSRAAIRDIESANATALLIDRDIQELRMRVDAYVASGADAQLEAVVKVHDRVASRLARAADQTSDAQLLGLFEIIALHVAEHTASLSSVESERELRRELVGEILPAKVAAVEVQLASLSAGLERATGSANLSVGIAKCQAAFLRAERSLASYFADPNTVVVDDALSHLNNARRIAQELSLSADSRNQLLVDFDEFERIGLRAVQATRSNLFFLNVVMAAEASEVAHYSGVLRQRVSQQRARIAEVSRATTANTTRLTVAMASAALVLSLLIAGRLVILIVPPVTRLTDTFEELATGSTTMAIMDSDTQRDDEIGRMAKAAKFFGDQNYKTRQLLGESEKLRVQLVDETRKLEVSNQELDNFAYVASHDLKSPLRGISQLAQWIDEDSAGTLSEESREHLALLTSRTSKMETLLKDLLDYSRAGRSEPSSERVDLLEMLEGIVELTDNPSDVRITLPGSLPTVIVVAAPLEQVLRNLIGNAVKHNHHNTGGNVDVEFTMLDGWCEFQVRDNGPGIEPKNHARAFEMYQRLNPKNVEGSGMGLAIIKKQVEIRGGKITLDSDLASGATFTFTWPLTQEDIANEQRKAS